MSSSEKEEEESYIEAWIVVATDLKVKTNLTHHKRHKDNNPMIKSPFFPGIDNALYQREREITTRKSYQIDQKGYQSNRNPNVRFLCRHRLLINSLKSEVPNRKDQGSSSDKLCIQNEFSIH